MIDPQYLYIEDITVLQKHFYRMGGMRPQDLFTRTRAFKDLIIYPKDSFDFVKANGNGFSLSDRITDGMKKPGRIVWRLSATLPLPKGIVLVRDMTPDKVGHYMLAPAVDMPLDKYLGLLQEIVVNRLLCTQLSSLEVANA
jgi:hypothetical protein